MKMTELEFGGQQPPIDGYAPAGFRVGGRFVDGPVILSPGGLQSWSGAVQAPTLDAQSALAIQALKGSIDVLLLGLGADLCALPAAFRAALAPLEADANGFGVETMATPAACRTYNVLLSEERRVAAALLPL